MPLRNDRAMKAKKLEPLNFRTPAMRASQMLACGSFVHLAAGAADSVAPFRFEESAAQNVPSQLEPGRSEPWAVPAE